VSQWRLLLTRPAEDCAALAQSLAAAGVGSSCLPLLAIEPVTVEHRQRVLLGGLHGFQAIIVVSKPAARLLLEQLAEASMQPPRQGWFTVGEATAAVLQGAGLEVNTPPRGDDSEACWRYRPCFRPWPCLPRVFWSCAASEVANCWQSVLQSKVLVSNIWNCIAAACRITRQAP